MVNLSLANGLMAHHCVRIIGWLLMIGLTFVVLVGDGRVPAASGADKRGAERKQR